MHLVRQSLNYVGDKQRKEVAGDLKLIYSAATREEAEQRLEEFTHKWETAYPTISPIWRRSWERVVPFLAYPEEIRRVIYTTNAIESVNMGLVNMGLRKIIKNRGSFPTDEAAVKVLYLALRNILTSIAAITDSTRYILAPLGKDKEGLSLLAMITSI